MPITIQLTPGLLTPEGQRTVFSKIAEVLLDVHGLKGNPFMTQHIIGHVTTMPEGTSYADGKPQSLAVVEVKVPSTTFPNRDVQQAFVERVTQVIDELKAGTHPRTRTYVNVTYAVDGAWGIGGKAYTNADLGAAIAAGYST
jgi:phenylpyruvate tautomerase PptA (4-oxalocrotonate tautomerase family)